MAIRKIAFVVEGDVFALLSVDDTAGHSAEGLILGMLSNPEIYDVTGVDDIQGMFNLDQNAFHSVDTDLTLFEG